MKIVLNPEFQFLKSFVENIPVTFSTNGECIYKERNEIRVFDENGLSIVVKSFKKPYLINRIAYSFIRPSKAKRSYKNACVLLEKEVTTPQPIAYIEEKKAGLLTTSYYISVYKNYPGILRELGFHPLKETKELAEAFACYTASLHEKGVLHLDYSSGNIIYENVNNSFNFCLIDINRMIFETVDEKKAAFNLRRLWGDDETFSYIAGVYAKTRGFEEDSFVSQAMYFRKKFWHTFRKKHPTSSPVRYTD